MEQELAQFDDWTEDCIKVRRERFEKWVLDRWSVDTPADEPQVPSSKLEAVIQLANECGVGEELNQLISTVRKLGLPIRPNVRSIMVSPPTNRNVALFTVWPEPGYLNTGIWHGSLNAYLDVSVRSQDVFGSEEYFQLRGVSLSEFLDNLCEIVIDSEIQKEKKPE